jgi:hypothetical protein
MKSRLNKNIQVKEEMKVPLEEESDNVKLDLLIITLIIPGNIVIKDSDKYS